MTGWRLNSHGGDSEPWRSLPISAVDAWSGPADYIVDAPLTEAVETALWLGQPLLVTGEPGCGKTELASYLGWRLGVSRQTGLDGDGQPRFEHALRFDTKTETRARELFYTIDLVERFHAAHVGGGAVSPLNFIRFQALGRAILYARPPDDLSARLEPWQAHPGEPRRSVVLIDEIDKAPSDVPNDLLMEIETMRFFIAEMNLNVTAAPHLRPILVITSNTEKPLPDAFLRRCVYYHIPFPSPKRLRQIVANRIKGIDADSPLLTDAVEILDEIRDASLRKKPATAELLGFVQALREHGYGLHDRLRMTSGWQGIARVTLLKTREDQEREIVALQPAGG